MELVFYFSPFNGGCAFHYEPKRGLKGFLTCVRGLVMMICTRNHDTVELRDSCGWATDDNYEMWTKAIAEDLWVCAKETVFSMIFLRKKKWKEECISNKDVKIAKAYQFWILDGSWIGLLGSKTRLTWVLIMCGECTC